MDQADLLPGLRPGSCLEHGLAHAEDHRRWSRRSFLSCLGLAVAGSAFTLGRTPIRAFGQAPLLSALRALETERILVLVQLSGGNDGLNTVVPVEDDRYYNARPTLAIARNQTLSIAPELGLHPSLASLEGLYGDGRLAIVQNVGYPSPDLSHFRSTDVWMSAQDAGASARAPCARGARVIEPSTRSAIGRRLSQPRWSSAAVSPRPDAPGGLSGGRCGCSTW